ncbi:MAG: amidase [Alphaproteobacteria bacterium]|nr:amidase [Alphaproteobacteria bacterium]
MAFAEYAQLDGVGLADLVRRKQVAPAELVETCIELIEKHNPRLNAVIHRMDDMARQAAKSVAAGPLQGVPFLLKDIGAHCAGAPYWAGSKVLKGYVPDHDTELTRRFKRAGLIICGKTNTPEFGFDSSTEPDLFGATRNPWDTGRTAGGSSGGSAAAVAAGIVPIAHANDGGGSIRIPAAACGLVGLKPTRLRNPWGPDAGDVAFGLAVEHVVTRSVRDSAAVLDATAGDEIGMPYAPPGKERPFLEEAGREPGRLRIAFTTAAMAGDPVDPECVAATRQVARLLEDLGHFVEEEAPRFADTDRTAANDLFKILASALNAANMIEFEKLTGRPSRLEDVEISSRACIEYGRTLTAIDLIQAVNRMHRIGRVMARFLQKYDILLTPSLAAPPIPLGHLAPRNPDLDGHIRNIFGFAAFTPLANVSGQPAISLPLNQSAGGLPVGAHFTARFGEEGLLFRLAAQLEATQPWADRHPASYG